MGFEALLGNRQLKQNLSQSFRSGRTAHFYLITGPDGAGKRTLAKLLSAALMCDGESVPCLGCNACRKVMAGTHPDITEVVDPEHKTVPVKMVREIRDQMFVRPNEGKHRICIFPQEMGIEGQNALLKVLEEPPSYGAFLLLTENPEKLLPTVRSRCVELKLTALDEKTMTHALLQKFPKAQSQDIAAAVAASGGYLGQAIDILEGNERFTEQTAQFAESFAARDAMGLLKLMVGMEKWKRDQLIPELESWRSLLVQSLAGRAGGSTVSAMAGRIGTGRSAAELMTALKELEKCIRYAQGNVSVAAICGYLQWALR